MASWRKILLIALLGVAFVAPSLGALDGDGSKISDDKDDEDEYADPVAEPAAALIARKYILEEKVVQGKNMTVVVTLYNVGKGCASIPAMRLCIVPELHVSCQPVLNDEHSDAFHSEEKVATLDLRTISVAGRHTLSS